MKRKNKAPLNKIPAAVEEESDHNSDVVSDVDSDEELAAAFEKGELQPGLNTILPYAKKELVNNIPGLKSKLSDLKNDLPWIERLDITNAPVKISPELSAQYGEIALKINRKGVVSGEEKEDGAQHDFKREMLFYRQAQGAVLEGMAKLKALAIPTKRPEDYFAQMIKSDAHMKKVRETLVGKQESLEKSEKAKKLREMKKMGKQIQVEVIKKRAKEKREMMDRVNKFKKGKTTKLDLDGPAKPKKKSGREKKKEYKDGKYGYGGSKKRGKYNTADSTADAYGGFKRGRNGPATKGKGGQNRPGKGRREKIRNQRK